MRHFWNRIYGMLPYRTFCFIKIDVEIKKDCVTRVCKSVHFHTYVHTVLKYHTEMVWFRNFLPKYIRFFIRILDTIKNILFKFEIKFVRYVTVLFVWFQVLWLLDLVYFSWRVRYRTVRYGSDRCTVPDTSTQFDISFWPYGT